MIPVRALRDCLDGVIPGVVSTCAPDGTPNVAYMSQGQYLDDQHLALSYQFFNRTHQNLLANPRVTLGLIHPQTAQQYRVHLTYQRTETEGPIFESMKAKLAGIASHTGMSGVFRLLGSDIYRIERAEVVPGSTLPAPPPAVDPLLALRTCMERLPLSPDAESLLDALLDGLQAHFAIEQALVMMLDPGRDRLYTVASRGYATSGVGSELPVGDGVIGVAARERVPIRISHVTSEYAYGLAMREGAERQGLGDRLETEIPFPGLAAPGSQLAVPIPGAREPLGVLFVESPTEMRFTHADEDALVALATQVGGLFRLFLAELELADEAQSGTPANPRPPAPPCGCGTTPPTTASSSGTTTSSRAWRGTSSGRSCRITRPWAEPSSATASCGPIPACACRTRATTWRPASCCSIAAWRSVRPACSWRRRAGVASGCWWPGPWSWRTWTPAPDPRTCCFLKPS